MKSVFYCIVVYLALSLSGTAQNLLNQPESIVFNPLSGKYLVSNIIGGHIVEVDNSGNQSIFFSDPSISQTVGLHVKDNVLYAATNQGLWGIDLSSKNVVLSLIIPDAVVLNDITSDTSGFIYVSDYIRDVIYKIDPVLETISIFIGSGLSYPNGLFFDKVNNHLLVLSQGAIGAPVLDVNLLDSTFTVVTYTNLGSIDGITIDNDGNYYISDYQGGYIYRYDNNFSSPGVSVFGPFTNPADIFYDTENEIMAVPIMNDHSYSLIQQKYIMSLDTFYGWAPLEINFTGQSDYEVSSWRWDFSDGSSSSLQSPTHTFSDPGIHNAAMRVITTGNDTLYRYIDNIYALADTLKADTAYGPPGSTVMVTVTAKNYVPLTSIQIPVEYAGPIRLKIDSINTLGCRTDGLMSFRYVNFDGFNKRVAIILESEIPLTPGEGFIINLFFTIHSTASPGESNPIIFDGYSYGSVSYHPEFANTLASYNSGIQNTAIVAQIQSCCIDIRGNINGDTGDGCDIEDLVYYVDYQFSVPPGPEPPCFEEADVNASGDLDIEDIVYLVEYQFNGGPLPLNCTP